MSKHLSDAECAAEYWRAEYNLAIARAIEDNGGYPEGTHRWHEMPPRDTWHRFMSHPHAFEAEESFASRMARQSIEAMRAKARDD